MKEIIAVIGVLLSGVVAEPPAPYPPSGFRPSGPAFELPQKTTRPQYLPPVDPRNPQIPNTEYGIPEEDVSVQGLPVREQLPIFQLSPINGQQYNGPQFNSDLSRLENSDRYKLNQYELQQQKYREFERQRQLDAESRRVQPNQPQPNPQVPRQFAQNNPSTTESSVSTKSPDDYRTESTTEIELNTGETFEDSKTDSDKKEKVTVEVSRQNLQEYPGELFLSSLAQLQLQPQFVPFQQFGQIRAPLYQPIQQDAPQQQVAGYNAATHFAALPSVLSQRQSVIGQPQGIFQSQQGFGPNPALIASNQNQPAGFFQAQPLNQPFINNQYQPLIQPQVQGFPQPIVVQSQTVNQPNQFAQPQQPESDEPSRQEQDQTLVYQQSYQPQEIVYQQPQAQYPNQYQSADQQNYFLTQAQMVNYPSQLQQYQNGFVPQQFLNQQAPQTFQGQDSLQSGLDINKDGNGLEQNENREDKDDADDENADEGSNATAVATAFGTRTQPRVIPRYGAPAPIPRVAASPQTTTEAAVQNEQATEDTSVVAEANAFATGRRKAAKLRSRRVRPLFTLDRSGHLVLAQESQ